MQTSNPAPPSKDEAADPEIAIDVADFSFSYDRGKSAALRNITLSLPKNHVTAFIGPSGGGKSTLLRSFNRLNDTMAGAQVTGGKIRVLGEDIHDERVDPVLLRRTVGMVLPGARPFPKSIHENMAYGLRARGRMDGAKLDQAIEKALREVSLWDEVKDRLKEPALGLDTSQQRRLCLARALAVEPEILLLDEPSAGLDREAAETMEGLMVRLRETVTVVWATQNAQQASRLSSHTAFFWQGQLMEWGLTSKLFTNPAASKTEDYISGRFG